MTKKRKSRRDVLKMAGAVGASCGLLVDVTSADPGVNTGFNPNKKSEVKEFLREYSVALNNISSKKERKKLKNRIRSRLSERHKQAILEYLKKHGEVEFGMEASKPNKARTDAVRTAASDGFYSYSYTVHAEIVTRVGRYDAFDYTHRLNWEVENGDVVDFSSRQRYNTYSHLVLYWSFESSRIRSSDIDDTNCSATRFAKFNRKAYTGALFSSTDTCTITLVGDRTGSGGAPRVLLNGDFY